MWTLRGDVPQTGSQTGITSKSIQTATTTQNKFDQHICGNGSYHHTRIARGRLLRLHGHLDGLTAQSSTTGRHWNWNWVPWSRRISEKTFFSEENASFFFTNGAPGSMKNYKYTCCQLFAAAHRASESARRFNK